MTGHVDDRGGARGRDLGRIDAIDDDVDAFARAIVVRQRQTAGDVERLVLDRLQVAAGRSLEAHAVRLRFEIERSLRWNLDRQAGDLERQALGSEVERARRADQAEQHRYDDKS